MITWRAMNQAGSARDRRIAWGLSWLAYASYYLGRKGFSVAKKNLHDQQGVSEAALGAIDSLYLSSYAGGLFVSGYLGDRIGARRLVGYGMLCAAACAAGFGASSTVTWFGVFFFLNGIAQSTGWPGTTRVMAEWTTAQNRGTVMSFWATCYQVGGVAASFVAGYLLKHFGWRSAFFGPALWLVAVGLLALLLLRPGPGMMQAAQSGDPSLVPPARILRSPLLWCYGASYFFIKFIRYALLFWLPYYLATRQGYATDTAAYVSTAFEVGGIVGVIVLGTLSDRLRRYSRSTLAAAALVLLAGALLLYTQIGGAGVWASVLGLSLIGATLFGPDALISGAAAQDAGGRHAAATATGFVNGVGSIGALLEGLLVPWVSRTYGWELVFPIFVGLAVLAALALVPTMKWAARTA